MASIVVSAEADWNGEHKGDTMAAVDICFGRRPLDQNSALRQVVGWPSIRAYRMNNLANQAKTLTSKEDETCEDDKLKDTSKKKVYNGSNKNNTVVMEKGHHRFVKVSMDGLPIGREVDLNAYACYETLAKAPEDMFVNPTTGITSIRDGESEQERMTSKLLNGSSEFVLTYEDKEADWMLVGDVPWEYAPFISF
ncbi:auxin-responsive protein IAA13-like [Malania oleifera]|uniref:auxin-responsive protein IAA13-like n=1 Tax=Malania oleifera TaxID=397392 RepID=UPI0025AE8697|nr:auxin-responsive protein IAA13-like [Malania oleifera]